MLFYGFFLPFNHRFKHEKWFELAWEGTRFLDLVRWGDAPKALAFKAHDKTPYLDDEFL
ncbi:MAG: hypothetical protein IKX11_01725 [Bacteroidales bacterium]|nr:hypothetical protein [Bacteroidales bacterium]